MKAILGTIAIVVLLGSAPACAQDAAGAQTPAARQACEVPAGLLASNDGALERVASSVKDKKKLDVLVVGSGSSSLASADGAADAYPARFEASLRERLGGVTVTVTTNLQPRRTAAEVTEMLHALVTERKPDLLIWQTGTVDAIRGIRQEDFRNSLDEGLGTVKAAGTDAILINLQYSPRLETTLAPLPYLDTIRAVAEQQEAPLFDRYAIMRNWSETGEFDFSNTSRSYELAKGVHDCLGRALTNLVITAARLDQAEPPAQR